MISIPRQPSVQSQRQHQYFSHDTPRQLDTFDYQSPLQLSTAQFNSNQSTALAALSDQLPSDQMQSDAWTNLAQATPKMQRFSHQRESSLSSLGSAGPASPFNNNTSNPQIAVTDSTSEGIPDLSAQDNLQVPNPNGSYYQLAKPMPFPGYSGLDQSMPEMAYPVTVPGPNQKPRVDRSLLPAPDVRSHPASVASSVTGDSPAGSNVTESDYSRRRKAGHDNVPKLDRTMTDVYGDELYNPNFAITSTSPQKQTMAMSPTNDVFNQRINAANSQHLTATHSPASSVSRDRSPFRSGSPFAASSQDAMAPPLAQTNLNFNSAQALRQQEKAQQEMQAFQQQFNRNQEPETPKTISPKDAMIEFNDADTDGSLPLFSAQEVSGFETDQLAKVIGSRVNGPSFPSTQLSHPGPGDQFNYMSSQMPAGVEVPQQYPFIARPHMSHESPPRLSPASSSDSGQNTPTMSRPRPMKTAADGGTYTCTYHGCTLRFETPMQLQRHKREGHRQTQSLGITRPHDTGMTSNLLNSQAGPHRCDRINPSTGKSCNTVFSRPYDLTRHEDTIHNARKQKVRCDLCTEDKTFSRADALTRHYRVCHPNVELPGKHKRRGGS